MLGKALSSSKEAIVDKEANVKILANKAKASLAHIELQVKSKKIYDELAWAYVRDKEEVRAPGEL